MDAKHLVTTIGQLESLYDPPSATVLAKQVDRLDDHCRAFVAASPFVLLATMGAGGVDCSPRGDTPGFVEVLDDRTLLLPDRRGNNRIDSLRNIVGNPEVGLIFLVPGIGETLRVRGRARISTEPALLERFPVGGRLPRTVIMVAVEAAFMQCSRAIVRSRLWDPASRRDRTSLPSMGTILEAHTGGRVEAAVYDAELPGRLRDTLY
ncbi:pyridoxamine 5'-phosphate oxidase family protein [Arenibaculum sp.]|jgi:hypothetical protein|uniref:pyridoxamine 5'-phosphate oxidase family protein n=1 Tax=Arenibaculum sp. TaxID=2865862 RepID=UPI002E0DFE66|nr:pyridoxamine 5'-phosphate oxidase family protein [Arenibaculum sp.]